MMLRYKEQFPFEKLITHIFLLNDAEEAMKKFFELDCLKMESKP
ncbi:MAG: hypothetical protein ACE5K3_01890 [bacterium]